MKKFKAPGRGESFQSGSADREPLTRPQGKLRQEIIAAVLTRAPGEWKTMALLIHDGGMDPGAARKARWSEMLNGRIYWISSRTSAGTFEIEQTARLRRHLQALKKEDVFVLPEISNLDGLAARRQWLNQCWKSFPQYGRFLKRFSIWNILAETYERLAREGKLPPRVLRPAARGLKAYVNGYLTALLNGEPPTGEATGAPTYNQYRALTKQELVCLGRGLNSDLKLAVLVSFYLLIPVDKLLTVDWEMFDLANRSFMVSADVKLPIHSALFKHLSSIPEKAGKLFKYDSMNKLRLAAGDAFRRAGVVDPRARLSSVRKTAILMLKQLGVSISHSGRAFTHLPQLPNGERPDVDLFEVQRDAFEKLLDILIAPDSKAAS